ncbi:Arm DNA-binding domain-containing protein [Dyadobacter sandarakinus]|uniref:Arm DNA-binding domain-containing protein n=1 Tax=Dyadobacter sandarakinus TaxID=2747268 RepID=A0ABX7I1T7_9BACT|nr:hypothetical protein HWI92_01975 [Dyadobacter sandarakinus]
MIYGFFVFVPAIQISVRQSKINRNNQLPLYMRVTVGRGRFQVATRKSVPPERWSGSSGKANGTTIDAREANAFSDSLGQVMLMACNCKPFRMTY